MRIAIIGAGAVGGFYGARLAQAGHEVSFVARGANLEAIRRRGLRVTSSLGDLVVSPRVESDPAPIGPVDLVIVAVKTYSNGQALPLLAPLVGADTVVLPLQNGVDSADQVAAAVGAGHTLAGTTYIATTLIEPGVIEHVGTTRRIILGEAFGERVVTARVERLRAALAAADIEAEASADVRIPLWEKLIMLAPIAGLTAAVRLPIGPAWAHAAFRDVFDRGSREIEAVARHAGVNVAADVCDRKHRYLDERPAAMRTSMMVDVTSGRPIELEALLGTIVRRGAAAGIPTPVVSTLYGILKPLEHGAPSA
jgi:2-dehydropantoate 2-reductase